MVSLFLVNMSWKLTLILSLAEILRTGVINNGVLNYGVDGKLHLVSKDGIGSGQYVEIVTGIGWNSKYPFTPLSKIIWIYLGSKMDFEVVEGSLGTLRVNAKDIKEREEEILSLGCGFLNNAHKLDQEPYGPDLCFRDFGIKLTEVILIIIFI